MQNEISGFARGTWYIGRTSLSLWRKRSGAITYAPLPGGEVADVVSWRRGSKHGTIVGIDRPLPSGGDWQWEWRGVQPLTLFIRSRWRFVATDPGQGWAITLFEKTPFTAAGVDLYFRSPQPDEALVANALRACENAPQTAPYRDALFAPPAWPSDPD